MDEGDVAARVICDPFMKDVGKQWCHGNATGCGSIMFLFSLMNRDAILLEVDVAEAGPHHLRATGSGMGGEGEHHVDEWLASDRFDVLQEFVDFGQRQEEAIPKVRLFLRRDGTCDLTLDLGPGLEGRLLAILGID